MRSPVEQKAWRSSVADRAWPLAASVVIAVLLETPCPPQFDLVPNPLETVRNQDLWSFSAAWSLLLPPPVISFVRCH